MAHSAMHYKQVGLGAVIEEIDGWQLAVRYQTVEEEIQQVLENVGICDVSPVGKLRLQGKDTDNILNVVFQGLGGIEIGRVARVRFEQDPGSEDILVAGLAGDDALILVAPSSVPSVLRWLSESPSYCAHTVDVTSALAGLKIAGSLAHRVLASVTQVDVTPEGFPDMSCAQGMVAEIHGTILRGDMGSLLSYDLYFSRDYGEYMWDALFEAGEKYGLTPFGTETLAHLRGD